MPRRVRGPDGKLHQFPDDATDAQISRALGAVPEANKAHAPKAKTWADQLGLNTPSDSAVGGFVKGAGAGAVDLAQGATSAVLGQLNASLDTENARRREFGFTETATLPRVEQPSNFSGTVGGVLPVVGEMMVGGAPVVKAARAAIPSTARAAAKFQDVMSVSKDIPINTKFVGDAALRIQELADRGGSMPMAVRKLLLRMTDPNKPPLAYGESRDFASNISRLSADEMRRLTPVVAKEVANLRVALNLANAKAAKAAGKLDEYESAMKEYAKAMRVRGIVNAAIEGAKKSAPYATVAGAGYWLSKKLGAMID